MVMRHSIMKATMRTPEILAPFDKRELEGITILPRVFETNMPENLIGFGRIRERPSASLDECLTRVGVIALIAKQNAPAKGLNNAPIVDPCTLLPTLAYSIASTPRPHMLVPIVVEPRGENPRNKEIEDMMNPS